MPVKLNGVKPTIRISAELRAVEGTANACALLALPKSAIGELPTGNTVVEGTLNGFPFRSALRPNVNGGHTLELNKELQAAAAVVPGETVTLEITRIDDETEIRVPADLTKTLNAVEKAKTTWEDITPMARRDWVLWISSAKQSETREIRINKACDMLAAGKRRVCCFGGLNWLTKDHPIPGGTWLPLPKVKTQSSTKRST